MKRVHFYEGTRPYFLYTLPFRKSLRQDEFEEEWVNLAHAGLFVDSEFSAWLPLEVLDGRNQKEGQPLGLGILVSHLFSDWCGGGDLNPYALRR